MNSNERQEMIEKVWNEDIMNDKNFENNYYFNNNNNLNIAKYILNCEKGLSIDIINQRIIDIQNV